MLEENVICLPKPDISLITMILTCIFLKIESEVTHSLQPNSLTSVHGVKLLFKKIIMSRDKL